MPVVGFGAVDLLYATSLKFVCPLSFRQSQDLDRSIATRYSSMRTLANDKFYD